jgi:adenylate cyclase
MTSSLRANRKSWKDKDISQPLDIRIGIHTDTCPVGNFGSADRLDYTTIGNGVNLASRLESNARPNQILISEDTHLLVREAIECDKLDKIQVKNITHSIQTYEVRGAVGTLAERVRLEEKSEGFSVFVEPDTVTGIEQKREILEAALALLDRLED